jgi:hypothetical protein
MALYASVKRVVADNIYRRLPRHLALKAELEDALILSSQLQDLAGQELQLKGQLSACFVQHRPFDGINFETGNVTEISQADSIRLAERIQGAYKRTYNQDLGPRDSQWLGPIADQKKDFHKMVLHEPATTLIEILTRPMQSNLFHGFDSISALDTDLDDRAQLAWRANWTYDNLLRLAEAVGVVRLENPEVVGEKQKPPLEQLLLKLDEAFGFHIIFPNPFLDEPGLKTSRGIATYRAVQALYQAWRISSLIKPGSKVAEIGAGTGRTAYYARQFGFIDYTIIDLPITNIAQAHFLGTVLGQDAISLSGELASPSQIKICTPIEFENNERFDLIVNVDSITEMAYETALSYMHHIKTKCNLFLSINHEVNGFTARELGLSVGMPPSSRESHWMRRGYVEEVFYFT